MKARWLGGGLAMVAVGALCALGPTPEAPRGNRQVEVPAITSLEGWLWERERDVPGLVSGAESRVQWAGNPAVATPLALVYVHGFSATPKEISPVVERLAVALQANAYWVRLAGHGQPGEALGRATTAQWFEGVAEAVAVGKRLGQRVVLIGTSTGATLAALHVLEVPDPAIMGLVAISPNFGPANKAAELILWPWGQVVLPRALGEHTWEPRNAQQELYWTTRYPTEALVPMMAVVEAGRDADWSDLSVPVLAIRNLADPVVDAAEVTAWLGRLPDVRDYTITVGPEEDGHVLAGDILAPHRNDEVVELVAATVASWAVDHEPSAAMGSP